LRVGRSALLVPLLGRPAGRDRLRNRKLPAAAAASAASAASAAEQTTAVWCRPKRVIATQAIRTGTLNAR
jgi:hypothetical protein